MVFYFSTSFSQSTYTNIECALPCAHARAHGCPVEAHAIHTATGLQQRRGSLQRDISRKKLLAVVKNVTSGSAFGSERGDIASLRASIEQLAKAHEQLASSVADLTGDFRQERDEQQAARKRQDACLGHIVELQEARGPAAFASGVSPSKGHGGHGRGSVVTGPNPSADRDVVKLIHQDKAFNKILARLQA